MVEKLNQVKGQGREQPRRHDLPGLRQEHHVLLLENAYKRPRVFLDGEPLDRVFFVVLVPAVDLFRQPLNRGVLIFLLEQQGLVARQLRYFLRRR